jgi:hypothetical protein
MPFRGNRFHRRFAGMIQSCDAILEPGMAVIGLKAPGGSGGRVGQSGRVIPGALSLPWQRGYCHQLYQSSGLRSSTLHCAPSHVAHSSWGLFGTGRAGKGLGCYLQADISRPHRSDLALIETRTRWALVRFNGRIGHSPSLLPRLSARIWPARLHRFIGAAALMLLTGFAGQISPGTRVSLLPVPTRRPSF